MAKKKTKKKVAKKKTEKKATDAKASAGSRSRTRRSFPSLTFEESLVLGKGIQDCAAGEKVRKLTLFEHLGKSPDSSASRDLITASNQYGLTSGGYQAEYLELTELGYKATSDEVGAKDRLRARFELAISGVAPFKALYDKFSGNKLPSKSVLADALRESGETERIDECVDAFIGNAKFLGILTQIAGAERLLSIDHAIEELPAIELLNDVAAQRKAMDHAGSKEIAKSTDWSKTCFVVTPIGEDGSEERQHADLIFNHLIEPAIAKLGFQVIRADKIAKPGMITSQVIEYVLRSGLVVADLSYSNPNVFYELSLRHVIARPCIQIVRKGDKLPFDTKDFRTIEMNMSSIYTLVPQIEVVQSELANQARSATGTDEPAKNPITTFFPGLTVSFPEG
ncbi:MAG: hypothetical protein WD114_06035 [Phycisphaerales bacterium]